MTRRELKNAIDRLSPTAVRFVARVVDSLTDPPRADVFSEGSWITGSAEWMEYFTLALSVHHSATTEPLGLRGFESVFRSACEHAGWTVDEPGSPTRRFLDLEVRRGSELRRLSLKTTAARKLSETTLHISKLTEAAWIQDTRKPRDRRDRILRLFREYMDGVDSIVMLRAFRREPRETPHRYQLVEVPAALFDSIQDLPVEAFESDAPVLPCMRDGEVAASIAVDRSDAKITVRNVRVASCILHAEWFS